MTEKCECCGEGKDPANPNGLDWETLCAQPAWQCNDCEQWNGEPEEVVSHMQRWVDEQKMGVGDMFRSVEFMHELRRAAEGKAEIYKVPPLNELLNHPVFDAELSKAWAAMHVLLEKEQDDENSNIRR